MNTVQTNVRVAESDRQLIIQVAQKLRSDADFRARLADLLADRPSGIVDERIKQLEQRVNWLLSGAIVVPRAAPGVMRPAPSSVRSRSLAAEGD